jgi:hypothetical protein
MEWLPVEFPTVNCSADDQELLKVRSDASARILLQGPWRDTLLTVCSLSFF